VWSAEDLQLGEVVAVKVVTVAGSERDGQEATAAQVAREVRLARRVTHANVCRLHDVHVWEHDEAGAVPFVSMELLGGESLETRLGRDGPLSPDAARAVLQQVAAGLAAAHSAGVVHRDLKSANIMLVDDGARAVICDFGLAWIAGTASAQARAGTPVTMAPEAVRGETPTAASDIYGYGVVAFEVLTGQLPYASMPHTSGSVAANVLGCLTEAGVPRRWRQVIQRCLSPDPEDRPSAATVLRVLAQRSRRARRWSVAAAAALAVVGMVAWTSLRGPVPRPSLAVLPLEWAPDAQTVGLERPDWLPIAVAELLTTELAATGAVCPIDRQRVADVAAASGTIGDEQWLGVVQRQLAVDLVLRGEMTWRDGVTTVALKLEGPAGGVPARTAAVSGTLEELGELAARAAVELVGASDGGGLGWPRPVASGAIPDYSRGVAALRAGEPMLAAELLEGAVGADPSFPLARASLARALAALGMDEEASRHARRAVELTTGWPAEMRLELVGLAAMLAGDSERAAAEYRRWCDRAPDAVEARLGLVRALIAGGRGDEALAEVAKARAARRSWRSDPRLILEEARAAAAAGLFERQLASARALRAAVSSPRMQARARLNEGRALVYLGRFAEAKPVLGEAAAMFESVEHQAGLAKVLNLLAMVASRSGRLEEAEVLYRQSLAASEAVGDRSGMAHGLRNLGIIARRRGELEGAVSAASRALALYRRIGDTAGAAGTLVNLAVARRAQGELEAAEELLQHALDQRRALGNERGCAVVLVNLGNVLLQQGRVGSAGAAFSEAAELARTRSDDRTASHAEVGQAIVQWHSGDADAARETLRSVRQLRQTMKDASGCAAVDVLAAQIGLDEGDCRAAAQRARRAAAVLVGERHADLEAAARAVAARALARCGAQEEAEAWLPVAEAATDVEVQIEVRLASAAIAAATGQYASAESELHSALAAAKRNGLEVMRLEILLMLGEVAASRGQQELARRRLLEVANRASELGLERLERLSRARLSSEG
jgi:tetratricopeptide (TPR) repeat protein